MKKITLIFFTLLILIIGISCASAADLNSSTIADDNYCISETDIGSGDIGENGCIADTDIDSGDIATPEIDISTEKTSNYTISREDGFINDGDMISRINTTQRDTENPILYDLAPQEVTDHTSQYLLEVPSANADWNYLSPPAEPKPFPHRDEKHDIDKTTLSSYASALFGIEGLFFLLCFI